MNAQAIKPGYVESLSEEESPDYPFKSWADMREALLEGLQTEFVGETYPLWEEAVMPVHSEVKRLLKGGEDKQQIMDDIVGMLCGEGSRYAGEFMGDCTDAIDLLLKHGATFPSHLLFDRWCDEDNEVEYGAYYARGELLDYYGPKGRVSVPKSLEGLEPQDWEEVEDFEELEEDEEAMELVRLRHLIYCSNWLQGRNTEKVDE
jgi:hypothetical protein